MSKRSPRISGPIEFEPPARKMPSGLLEAAVQATQTGSPCFASMDEISPLLAHPSGQLVEFNDAMVDASGRVAVRATAAGAQVFQTNGNGAIHEPSDPWAPQQFAPGQDPTPFASSPVVGSHTAVTPRPVFKKGIPIPPPRARRESTKKYAFNEMEVGDCFDTMPAGDSPEPWKKLASASSAASKRFAPKKFETWPIEEGGVKFARTWRIV